MSSVLRAFHGTVHRFQGGADGLALALRQFGHRVSGGVLRNKANPEFAGNSATLADADAVMAVTRDYAVLHALCANHSHVAIHVDPDVQPCDLAVLEMVTHVWLSHGQVGAAIDTALADQHVDVSEMADIEQAIYRHEQALHALKARLKALVQPSRPRRRS